MNHIMSERADQFSAGEQSLGYQYQSRFGLLQMMQLPEDTALLIEKDDDLDFADGNDSQTLASLKHKSEGDRLADLSTDFWKSIRIWLARYKADGKQLSRLTFFLFTTGSVAEDSFLTNFLPQSERNAALGSLAGEILGRSKSELIQQIKADFDELGSDEKNDFLERITIFDHQVRIDGIPEKIMALMRTVRPPFRTHVLQRLEGWWIDVTINLTTGKRTNPIYGREIDEMLAEFADQYKKDNLPIEFRNAQPPDKIDPESDNRMFVRQLHALKLKPTRVQRSILDYYRAFEQRSSWLRSQVVLDGELEEYEDRLVDEWDRFRNIYWENLSDRSTEEQLVAAGRELLNWAETNDSERLRIRPLVTEAYVMIGSYHILANGNPAPKIHWHPEFVSRLENALGKPE